MYSQLTPIVAVAGVVSVYSVWDMLQYNRARRAEWIEAQKRLEADELATARLAYLKGDATEDQILLVEEANREAEKRGEKLPSLLAPPEHRTHFEEHVAPALHVGNKASPVSAAASAPVTPQQQEQAAPAEKKGWFSFLSGSKKDDKASPVAQAWEQEKENQRRGGSLDRIGLEGQQAEPAKKSKGWWPW